MKFKLSLFIILLSINLYGVETQVLEFNNKPVVDVLTAIADLSGKNIIPDDTVTGSCSYYFTTSNMEEALDLFLKSQDLYIEKVDTAYRVSRIYIDIDDAGLVEIKSVNTDIQKLVDRISKEAGITILYDSLPRVALSLNSSNVTVEVLLEIIIKRFSEYSVLKEEGYFYIKKESPNRESNNRVGKTTLKGLTRESDGTYSVDLKKVRFREVLEELFTREGLEYSIQGRNDNIIDRLSYSNRSFEEILNLILEGGSCDYVLSNSVYYIFDINRNEVSNKHIETNIIKLHNITTKELLKLMPGSFMSSNTLKVDDKTNSAIVYGTKIKTSPIINFIELIDKDTKRKPYLVRTDFISSDTFKNYLLKTYPPDSIINVDKDSFLILLTKEEHRKLEIAKESIDIAPNSRLVTLKYLKSSDLMENLPKSVEADQIVVTKNPSLIFYYGEEDGYKNFLRELSYIDKPIPQIKYKVLVIENNLDKGTKFGVDYSASSPGLEGDSIPVLPEGEWVSYAGGLGSLLGLNLNVLSAFGPLFSFDLQASLSQEKTKIHVDTTLKGLSGKKVSFRNTKTSRFYAETVSSDGETEKTGTAQEVSWGIILDIEGWTSGDGMVTVNVQATISDGNEVSGETKKIPSTSEKIVNTEVRTREGVPVIIGGLKNTKKIKTVNKTPFLGSIPLLGYLFRHEEISELNSEFTIYLLPYIEEYGEDNLSIKLKEAYREYRSGS